MVTRRAWGGAFALGILAAACGKERAPASVDSASPSVAAATRPAAATACVATGHWSACQMKKRLDEAGLAPRDTTQLDGLPALAVKPQLLMLGNAGFAYYLYPDSMARHQAAATLDTMRYIPQEKPLTMRNEATRIENDNALAILVSRNEHQRERVSDAVTAGPPQP